MTRQWYIEHGYKLSALIEQAEIDRAEADVIAAYISPIKGGAEIAQGIVDAVTANLAFLLLLQRSVFATRAGAKTKTGYNSADVDAWAILQQEAASCHLALESLKTQEGANADAEVIDICRIYFKTNFISI